MKTILTCLLTTALLATIVRADVFIYRGVDKFTADATTAAPFGGKSPTVYFVVDFDAGQIGQILYGRIANGKHFQRTDATSVDFTTATQTNDKVASVITDSSTTNNSPTDFKHFTSLYRGTNTSLLIRKTPVPTMVLRPNVLKGFIVNVTSNHTFSQEQLGLTFQGALTITANNANQTVNDVLDTLATALTAKGFISF